ncbi:TrkH family potassium uptake protein [Helicovermis profundi]|uniref:TrkH family potassium uptake protein n=2 Tax=Helicovermis profundi TaxID=3065157 RepID=A0AAU9E8L1_9FIRM|nr:TrkH family potassium uptake protein [Clostridia bacterium S502]
MLSSFIIPSILSLLLGVFSQYISKNNHKPFTATTGMLLCTFAWILLSIVGAIPFMIGLNESFVNSFFEAVSGFTTTGITVFTGLDKMPYSILFWRALIQWLGGLGILTFFLLITFKSEGDLWHLFSAEGHKIDSARPVPNVFKTVKILWSLYIFYTLLETVLLFIAGLSPYEAFIHSLTSLSTGGFSNHDASVGYYKIAGFKHYRAIEYIITIFMFLGGVNFLMHYNLFKLKLKNIKRDLETRSYLNFVLGFTLLILIGIFVNGNLNLANFEESFRKTIFQVVSLITTTGFGTEDIGSAFFPAIAKQLFILLMIIGGCVGSTAGGVKVIRIVLLRKLLKREVRKVHLPSSAILPVTAKGTIVSRDEIFKVSALLFAWVVLIFIGAGITALFSDLGPFEAFSGMASAVGNIGPFYFSVDKMISLSPVIKYTYIIGMLAGRLELLPLLVVFNRKSWL